MTTAATARTGALADRVCDETVFVFALWTLCCHLVVASGGGLRALVLAFSFALFAGLCARHIRSGARDRPQPADAEGAAATSPESGKVHVVGLGIGLATAVAVVASGSALLVWGAFVWLLTIAAIRFVVQAPPAFEPARGTRAAEGMLWAIAFACVAVALAVHRPDLDDAFYVNVAVAAADVPERALLSSDTLLGDPSLPLHMPAHRIHS